MSNIDLRYGLILSQNFGVGVQTITADLRTIPFVPDEMIVKYISHFEPGTSTSTIIQLKCDFTTSVLASLVITANVFQGYNLDNRTTLNYDVRGIRTFYVQDIVNSVTSNGRTDGQFCCLLEFVKYKK